ncbi:hypothetical protein [Clostridium tyrobutyricum]|uniref:hypothetical protein n=1 Tax=Clostridium tyrobutyricum TaxID=1519 RepID=UPI001C38B8F3|nr:hypothetical protein [Clostridium tyrobutyricum]MBV4427538.1 hypothetical protein [Clostridium tyrobutyricum]MBV4442725.1 hypothetical protein [Clostridium tyrobutyricum]
MYKFFIIHIFICILFYIFNLKNHKANSIYKFLIVFLIPIFGFIYFIIIFVLRKFKSDFDDTLLNYDKYIRDNISNRLAEAGNKENEMNIVPVSEALVLNDSKTKRRLLIDVVKKNSIKNIPILKKALENSDTEVSHYAATAITELKNNFISTLQEEAIKYEKDKGSLSNLVCYVYIINNYINSGLLDKRSLKKYKYLYSEKLGELLSISETEKKYFIDKINCDIELGNYNSAKEYCDKFYKAYPESESAYMMKMKLYYELNDFNNFNSVLLELKKSNLKFSNKVLNIVRFWTAGELNES